jgi:hypothetical protein
VATFPLLKGFFLISIALAAMFTGLRLSLSRARRTGVLLRLSE